MAGRGGRQDKRGGRHAERACSTNVADGTTERACYYATGSESRTEDGGVDRNNSDAWPNHSFVGAP